MKKLSISIIASLVLLLAACVFAVPSGRVANADVSYVAYVGGVGVSATEGAISVDPATSTLILNGANITAADGSGAAITSAGLLNVYLVGANTITLTDVGTCFFGIKAKVLSISGEANASLTVNLVNTDGDVDAAMFGISADSFNMKSGRVTANLSDANRNDTELYGVYANGLEGGITLTEGDLEISKPRGLGFAMYTATENVISLASGKGFLSAVADGVDLLDTDGNLPQLTALLNGTQNEVALSVRTKYALEHYVMDTSGAYPASPTATTDGLAYSGSICTFAEHAEASLLLDGITYGRATDTAGAEKPSAAVSNATLGKLYYSRAKYAVTKSAGAGSGFDLSAEEAYVGSTVTVSGVFFNPDGYDSVTVSAVKSGETAAFFDYEDGTSFVMPAGAVTVSSTASAKSFALALNLNGGTLSAQPTSYTYGATYALPTAITKANCVFCGWYAAENLSGSAVTEIAAGEYGAKTFYAKWNAATLSGGEELTLGRSGGFEAGVKLETAECTVDEYKALTGTDLYASFAAGEGAKKIYRLSLYSESAGVKTAVTSPTGAYTVKIKVDTDALTAKLLVVNASSVTAREVNVTNGYAIFSVDGLSDVVLVGEIAPTVEPSPLSPTTDGSEKKDIGKTLLWLWILLPCLALAAGGAAFCIVKKKRGGFGGHD